MKKFLSCILILALVIACVYALSAQTNAATSTICGENLKWALTPSGALVISGTGPMRDFNDYSLYSPWFSDRAKVKSVVIGEGVTSISNFAFYGCGQLESVTIANTVTTIGDSAFRACGKLTSIDIPDSVVSIGDKAFDICRSLSFNIYDNGKYLGNSANPYAALIDTPDTAVTSIAIHPDTRIIGDSAFYNCKNLTSVAIPENVDTIGIRAFESCTRLTSVAIPSSVTVIGEKAFSGCDWLSSVFITDLAAWCAMEFEDSSANPMSLAEYLYLNGKLVTHLTIPEGVEHLGKFAFYSCNTLESVTIADSVQSIGEKAFTSCINLETVTTGNGVTAIGDKTFYSCSKLTDIHIGSKVSSIGKEVFSGCSSLSGIWADPNNPVYCSDEKGILFSKDKATLIRAHSGISGAYTIPDSVTAIGEGAFQGCHSLTAITIADSVQSIGASAFFYCYNLKTATIGNGVTTIGDSAFYYCALSSVTIGEGLTTVGNKAFSDCFYLTDVYYAADGAKWKTISVGSSCEDLTDATIHYGHIHDYSLVPPVTVAATCTQEGYVEYTCIYGETHRERIPKLPHNYTTEEIIEGPLCTYGGYAVRTCADCNYKYEYGITSVTGHDYTAGEMVIAPTCAEDGFTGIVCAQCGNVDFRHDAVPALGHKLVIVPAVAPTCTELGLTAGSHCERCQMVGIAQTEVPATGHSFADGVCSACGEPECTPGDLTGDGNINSLDGLLLMRYLNGWNVEPTTAMDVNADGEVNSLDGLMLMRYLNGWNVTFG